MTKLPPDELCALDHAPFSPGAFVLELGNKKNSTGLYRDWYTDQGLRYECVDWNGLDGAWKFDMRTPGVAQMIRDAINDGQRFPVITNFGFTEHVGETLEEQLECWRNIHDLLQWNGTLCLCMPIMPYWKGHGRWMPTPEWYQEMADLNDYYVIYTTIWKRVRPTFVSTMVKRGRDPWIAPADSKIERSDL